MRLPLGPTKGPHPFQAFAEFQQPWLQPRRRRRWRGRQTSARTRRGSRFLLPLRDMTILQFRVLKHQCKDPTNHGFWGLLRLGPEHRTLVFMVCVGPLMSCWFPGPRRGGFENPSLQDAPVSAVCVPSGVARGVVGYLEVHGFQTFITLLEIAVGPPHLDSVDEIWGLSLCDTV